jgi:hypothetical protein
MDEKVVAKALSSHIIYRIPEKFEARSNIFYAHWIK